MSEYIQRRESNLQHYSRVFNGQSGESLHLSLLRLGNPKSSGRLLGKLNRAPATPRLPSQQPEISVES